MNVTVPPEIILNLWYLYDNLGAIYSLRGRCYVGSGSDEEKLAFLRRFAASDYLIAQSFPVPERLYTTLVTNEGAGKIHVTNAETVEFMGGPQMLFEEVFVEMEKQLPALTRLSIGPEPLTCITPLLGNEDGNLTPVTSPVLRFQGRQTGMVQNRDSSCDEAGDADNDKEPRAGHFAKDGIHSHTRPDLVSAAMSVKGGQIALAEDHTFRLRPGKSDYLLWIKCKDPQRDPAEFIIADFWEFREGDQLLITNREQDYPATIEQMEEGGPSLWKASPGDRLAWVGWRFESMERSPTLIALIDCLCQGYVYGEPESPTLDSVMSFGASTVGPTPDVRSLWMVGYDAAVALGVPETWRPPE